MPSLLYHLSNHLVFWFSNFLVLLLLGFLEIWKERIPEQIQGKKREKGGSAPKPAFWFSGFPEKAEDLTIFGR